MRKPKGDASPDEVRAARALNRWYPQAHDAAVAMWTRGISGPEISDVLRETFGLTKTKSVVIGRMYRAGLAYEGPPSDGPGKGRGRGVAGTERRWAFMSAAALERVRERDRLRKRKRTPAAPRAPKPGRLARLLRRLRPASRQGCEPLPISGLSRASHYRQRKPHLMDTTSSLFALMTAANARGDHETAESIGDAMTNLGAAHASLVVYPRYSMDVRDHHTGTPAFEALVLSLVNNANGYANDMVRVTLSFVSDADVELKYRLLVPEQHDAAKALRAGLVAVKVGAALERIFAKPTTDPRERAATVYTAMAVETVRADGQPVTVHVCRVDTDVVSGAERFSDAVDELYEDHFHIESWRTSRVSAA